MVFRIFTVFCVVLIVFPVCYFAWFWGVLNLIPPDFGMPTYEDEVEWAVLIGSVVFGVVPLLITVRICGSLIED